MKAGDIFVGLIAIPQMVFKCKALLNPDFLSPWDGFNENVPKPQNSPDLPWSLQHLMRATEIPVLTGLSMWNKLIFHFFVGLTFPFSCAG